MNESQVTPTSSTPAPVESPQVTPAPVQTTAAPDTATAEKLAALEKTAKEYEEYRQKTDPVLETLWSDQELLAKATEVHNKRLGIIKDDASSTPTPNSSPAPVQDNDTRLAMINKTQADFETKMGIDTLPEEKKREVRGMIGQMLKEMLDPKGNKSVSKVFEEVSLVKLPWYLEKAYQIINRDNDINSAVERGKNEVLAQYEGDRGMVGSMPSGSAPTDQVSLSQVEKAVAAKMGISEEDYLKNKKDTLALRQG